MNRQDLQRFLMFRGELTMVYSNDMCDDYV